MTTTIPKQVPKALIADDDATIRRRLARALTTVWPELRIVEEPDGIDAWDGFLEHEPALCFLDVRMPGLTGIEVAQRIADRAQIVFLAEKKDRAIEAFQAADVAHLIKPFEPLRIAEIVTRLQASLRPEHQPMVPSLHQLLDRLAGQLRRPAPLQVIQVGEGPQAQWLDVDDIIYLEADARYTRVVSRGGEMVVRKPLKLLAAQLDPLRFWQINRFTVVAQQHILDTRRLDEQTMVLTLRERPKTLPVAPHFQSLFGDRPRHRADR